MSRNVVLKGFALALIGIFSALDSSFSEERCNLRAGYPVSFEPHEQFAGMFRVLLHSPDIRDPAAIQNHTVLSKIWRRTVYQEILRKTRGSCRAIIHDYFPGQLVSLIVFRTTQIDRERLACTQALEDVLQNFLPTDELIKSATKWTASIAQMRRTGRDAAEMDPNFDASIIQDAALQLIYEKNSLLHALISVDVAAFEAVDAASLRTWIQSQRQPRRPLLESIPHCLPPRRDLAAPDHVPPKRHVSTILPAGEINLSRALGGSLPAGPLRHGVIVGHTDQPPRSAVGSEIGTTYCMREHVFPIVDDFSPHATITVRLRCSETGISDLDSWVIIYCDPSDCTSERIEKAVMTAVANDPEILKFARRGSDTESPRGPYLVTIR